MERAGWRQMMVPFVVGVDVAVDGGHFLRGLIDVGPDAQLAEHAGQREVPWMRTAHPFSDIEIFRRPAFHPRPRPVADGDACGVAGQSTSILVARNGCPEASEVDLRQYRRGERHHKRCAQQTMHGHEIDELNGSTD